VKNAKISKHTLEVAMLDPRADRVFSPEAERRLEAIHPGQGAIL
jgi:hypothetical protein